MWWNAALDVASLGCLGVALWLRFRWRDPQGGLMFAGMSSMLSTWSGYRRRWARRRVED